MSKTLKIRTNIDRIEIEWDKAIVYRAIQFIISIQMKQFSFVLFSVRCMCTVVFSFLSFFHLQRVSHKFPNGIDLIRMSLSCIININDTINSFERMGWIEGQIVLSFTQKKTLFDAKESYSWISFYRW